MSKIKHIIIFSHGFGVKKDARGLFSDIAGIFIDSENVMFDYNVIDEEKNLITVKPFSEQAAILKNKINGIVEKNPGAVIDIICHSQGAIIAGLAKPEVVRKIILIAPPSSSDVDRMINTFKSRPGTVINFKGISRLARNDGSMTIILPEYWTERKEIKPLELYKNLSGMGELIIINANQDEVLDKTALSGLEKVKIINIDGNHNFSGEDRKKLLEIIEEFIDDKNLCQK